MFERKVKEKEVKATNKITYQDKGGIQNPAVSIHNQVRAEDLNEIKNVVNNNADELDKQVLDLNQKITNLTNNTNNNFNNYLNKTTTTKQAVKAEIEFENDITSPKLNVGSLRERNKVEVYNVEGSTFKKEQRYDTSITIPNNASDNTIPNVKWVKDNFSNSGGITIPSWQTIVNQTTLTSKNSTSTNFIGNSLGTNVYKAGTLWEYRIDLASGSGTQFSSWNNFITTGGERSYHYVFLPPNAGSTRGYTINFLIDNDGQAGYIRMDTESTNPTVTIKCRKIFG